MRERPVTVLIFGILNIGFGVLGLGGVLTQRMFESFATQSPNPSLNSTMASTFAFLDAMNKNPTYLLWRDISSWLDGAASFVLLTAGIGLLLLKNWARLVSVGYSVYKMIFVVANMIVLYVVLGDLLQKALQNVAGVLVAAIIVAALAGVVLMLAYPALLLFFMTRPKILPAFQPTPVSPP